MPEPRKPERRFNDEEVALIIKRAAELQQTEQTAQETSSALSLTEVEEIAREAGIDPLLIRRAAVGLDQPTQVSRPSAWLGSPTHIVYERVVDGEIPVEEFEMLTNEIRRTLGDNGEPSVLGRSLAWSSSGRGGRRRSQGRNIDVSVVTRGGVTTIRVEEELRNLAGAVFGGIVGGGGGGSTGVVMGIGMGVFHSAPVAGLLWVSVVGGMYTLARTIFGRVSAGRERQLSQLANRLEAEVQSAVPPALLAAAEGAQRSLPDARTSTTTQPVSHTD